MLLSLWVASCTGQPSSAKISGTWKGTSLCQVPGSPCHDETVVFYFSRQIASEDTFTLRANKIVNGREEEMGELNFVYDKAKQTLTCKMTNKGGKYGEWLFKIDEDKMHGTLTVEGNILYRLIELEKGTN